MGNKEKFVEGALLGAVIGAAAGMFLAPKSGKKLQKDLRQLSTDFYKTLAPRFRKMKKAGKKEYRNLARAAIVQYAIAKKISKREREELLKKADIFWENLRDHPR